MSVNWIGCVLHACLLHCTLCVLGSHLSGLCLASPTNSGSGGSPASPRPTEEGVGLGVQWETAGGGGGDKS